MERTRVQDRRSARDKELRSTFHCTTKPVRPDPELTLSCLSGYERIFPSFLSPTMKPILFLPILIFSFVLNVEGRAQPDQALTTQDENGEQDLRPSNELQHALELTNAPAAWFPYAGKIEPRVGNWFQAGEDDLRLDIGTSIELYNSSDAPLSHPVKDEVSAGVEFFTWTQLRAAGRFKFPVEAVDYHFGVFASYHPIDFAPFPLDVRLRVAHISAHLVDGDPGINANPDTAITFSREFVDLLVGANDYGKEVSYGWYVGGVWLFSTIPSSIGRVNPYVGLEYSRVIWEDMPLTLRLGYEFRLNTELATIGENHARVGLKFADLYDNGVVLEAIYYAGRSPFGQFFDRREEHFSIGFLVEH